MGYRTRQHHSKLKQAAPVAEWVEWVRWDSFPHLLKLSLPFSARGGRQPIEPIQRIGPGY